MDQPIDHLYHAAYRLELYYKTLTANDHIEFIGGVIGSLVSYLEANSDLDQPVPAGVK